MNCCADGTMEKSQKNGKAGGNQANKQTVPSNEQLDYIYRVLRSDEDPSKGLQARDPSVTNVKPSSHVHGEKRSPYISTCATLEAAEMYASLAKEKGYQRGPLVKINIKKLKQMANVEIIVLNKSHFSEKDARGRNWAFKYREVLIRGNIPAECIEFIEVFEESEEYDIEDYSSEDQDPEDFHSEDQDTEDFSSEDQKVDAKNEYRSDKADDESESLSEEFAKRTKISDNGKYKGLDARKPVFGGGGGGGVRALKAQTSLRIRADCSAP